MRGCRRKYSGLILPVLLLSFSAFACAAKRIKVQITETTQTILIVPLTVPGSPEQISTHCDATANGNTASGDCSTVLKPATETTSTQMPTFLYSAKAVLPDGSHVALGCGPVDKSCWAIASTAPEKSTSECVTAAKATICTRRNLGTYDAKRNKSELLIYTPTGKVKYQITGSW